MTVPPTLPLNLEPNPFLELNREELARLVTFVRFAADERLTIGFISINFASDRQILLQALQQHPRCQNIQFAILDFPDPNLRFLRDAIVAALPSIHREPNKKLVLVITGLEQSIGMVGDYPPLLQDLNYVRDAFTNSVAHPMLICLPDYSLTRLARFAPDFWAWRVAVFQFQSEPTTVHWAEEQTLQSDRIRGSLDKADKQKSIDLLERLLMEYSPIEQPELSANRKNRIDTLNELGRLYLEQVQPQKAEDILEQVLVLAVEDDTPTKATKSMALNTLGQLRVRQGDIDKALSLYQQSLELYEQIKSVKGKAITLNSIALAVAQQRKINWALKLYQQALELQEQAGDLENKAITLNNMALIVVQQGDINRALQLHQQSLEIQEQIGDMRGKAFSLGHMALVVEQQGKIDLALRLYQQSLELQDRLGNVRGKALILTHAGRIKCQLS